MGAYDRSGSELLLGKDRGMKIIEFRLLTKEDKARCQAYLLRDYRLNSHLSFTNLYMWREPYHLMLAEEDGILYMKVTWQGADIAFQPMAPQERWQEAVDALKAQFDAAGQELRFMGLEEPFADWLKEGYAGGKFVLEANRDEEDYVYLAEKLRTLSGRKLHAKKNHLNAFHKLYPLAVYEEISEENIADCRRELDAWYKERIHTTERENPFIGYERKGILEVFEDYAYFDLRGGAIRVGDRIVAFSFGERLNRDTAVIHVEKADPNVRGAFTAINQSFVEHAWKDMTYINREEDMGLPGLRHAKESYKPEKMIVKYTARYIG